MKLVTTSSLVALFVSQFLCAGAQAAPLSALEVLQQFNLVAFGSVNSTSHVDGRTYVGGSVAGGEYAGHPSSTPASAYAGLTVGGSASGVTVNGFGAVIGGSLSNSNINSGSAAVLGSSSNVNFNGGAYVAGGASGTNFNGSGRINDLSSNATLQSEVAAATSTNFRSVLSGLSDQLSQLSSTGSSVTIDGNRAVFTALANASGIAVFDLTGIDTTLFKLAEFAFDTKGAKTIIFNTDEKTYNISANFLGGSASLVGAVAIWNFYNATSLTLNNQFGGAILATDAALTNFNNIEGTVVVNSLTQRGEIHQQSLTAPVSDQQVPEPGSLALLLGALAVLAARRKYASAHH
ncbi:collagen-binding domain-containing protein [Rhodocyclus tenuis]|uniref:collagen-binding domain-containing protein n=1 Tax=Rhodocyclus tenuis TaxID=1066 RepID=UPI001907DB08|nr:collagen-binding domain-containing protein [Rhodocyclus tenuis]MBK1681441.1 hypothetical protein [Rhodocyclus tenuis]